jgi:hypothetical protein
LSTISQSSGSAPPRARSDSSISRASGTPSHGCCPSSSPSAESAVCANPADAIRSSFAPGSGRVTNDTVPSRSRSRSAKVRVRTRCPVPMRAEAFTRTP